MIVPIGDHEVLGLIPARGGSKGIPRKNLISVAGRPLIAHTIDQARRSNLITRVVVSTDDAEIAQVAEAHGAEVPFMRPAEFAQDLSPDIDVFLHALRWLRDNESYFPDLVVHLRATAPVRRVSIIDQAIQAMLETPEADSLRSVSWPEETPYKMWRMGDDGFLHPLLRIDGLPEAHSMARQFLPEVFWQNGYVDVVRPRTILELQSMCGEHVLPLVIHEPIYDIDYPEIIPEVERALERLEQSQGPPEKLGDQFVHHPH